MKIPISMSLLFFVPLLGSVIIAVEPDVDPESGSAYSPEEPRSHSNEPKTGESFGLSGSDSNPELRQHQSSNTQTQKGQDLRFRESETEHQPDLTKIRAHELTQTAGGGGGHETKEHGEEKRKAQVLSLHDEQHQGLFFLDHQTTEPSNEEGEGRQEQHHSRHQNQPADEGGQEQLLERQQSDVFHDAGPEWFAHSGSPSPEKKTVSNASLEQRQHQGEDEPKLTNRQKNANSKWKWSTILLPKITSPGGNGSANQIPVRRNGKQIEEDSEKKIQPELTQEFRNMKDELLKLINAKFDEQSSQIALLNEKLEWLGKQTMFLRKLMGEKDILNWTPSLLGGSKYDVSKQFKTFVLVDGSCKHNISWDRVLAENPDFWDKTQNFVAVVLASHLKSIHRPEFVQNFRAMNNAGIGRRGALHVFINLGSAEEQFQNFKNFLEEAGFDKDSDFAAIEFNGISGSKKENTVGFIELIKKIDEWTGQKTVIRTEPAPWNDRVEITDSNRSFFRNHPLWIVDQYGKGGVPDVPGPWLDWFMWEYNEQGRLNGIAGNVPLSRLKSRFIFLKVTMDELAL